MTVKNRLCTCVCGHKLLKWRRNCPWKGGSLDRPANRFRFVITQNERYGSLGGGHSRWLPARAGSHRLLRRLTKWIRLRLPRLVKSWHGETWPRGIGQRSRRPRYRSITRSRVPAGFFSTASANSDRPTRCEQVACERSHVYEGERADGATAVHRIVFAGYRLRPWAGQCLRHDPHESSWRDSGDGSRRVRTKRRQSCATEV